MTNLTTVETVKVIVFQVKDKEYAIPVTQVKAIEKIIHITRIPKTVSFVKGVINLRGVITPIIDLRARFEMEEEEYNDRTRIIIVNMENMDAGLIVDAANDVLDIPVDSVEPHPEVVGNIPVEYISGVAKQGKRLLILVDLEKVLKQDEIKVSSIER